MKMKLILEDGTAFVGRSFGCETSASGEVVFNTGMVGYPESLTDPSYKGQILVLTYPLIGNYGVCAGDIVDGISRCLESEKIQVSGLIVSDYSCQYHHWHASKSLSKWLREHEVPGVYGVDTREITKLLREKGTMLGKLVLADDVDLYDPNKENLVAEVSAGERQIYGNGRFRVLLVDCGVKHNIIRCFLKRDVTLIRVPWDYDFINEEYDGLFISNGPGDPKMCGVTIANVQKALKADRPIWGICLGHQILALAAGADTYKLKYGHRSQNQPCNKIGTKRCYITSQNHGYAVDAKILPDGWEEYFVNVNDNSNEGIKHKTKPFWSVQFHPEAAGGPTDTEFLFDEFLDVIKKCQAKRK